MKIVPQNIERFLANPDDKIKAILLYGPNNLLIKQRAKILISKFLGDNINHYSYLNIDFNQIKDDIFFIKRELMSLNFVSSKKLIKISQIPSAIPKELNEILSNIRDGCKIIIVANVLTPTSSLRKFFEDNEKVLSIACYDESNIDIRNYVINNLAENNYQISKEIVDIFIDNLNYNKSMIINELEKLKLYCIGNRKIDFDDIISVTDKAYENSVDDFCQSFILKDALSIRLYESLLEESTSIIHIIRVLLKYINKLIQIISYAEHNQNINQVIKNLSPPIFFKQIPIYIKAANIWNTKKLIEVINLLTYLEISAKKTANIQNIVFKNFILEIISS